MVEYIGTSPKSRLPHGLCQNKAPGFVRTRPEVLDDIHIAVGPHRQPPKDVHTTAIVDTQSKSFDKPRDHKQLKNIAQAESKKAASGNQFAKTNIADDIQTIVHNMQEHPFVQSVSFSKGTSPIITAYLLEQIQDMKRFCSPDTPSVLRSVVGVDRTFNEGPCYVTTLLYKNMSIHREAT